MGSFVYLPSSKFTEIVGLCGYDFVVIDMEHGPVDFVVAEEMIRAANYGLEQPLSEYCREANKQIYGHFSKHLGRCIYDGIWVGADSSIPNIRGIRSDISEALRHINIPNLRWPGGCFADEYHWRDGIGPYEDRPCMVNTRATITCFPVCSACFSAATMHKVPMGCSILSLGALSSPGTSAANPAQL